MYGTPAIFPLEISSLLYDIMKTLSLLAVLNHRIYRQTDTIERGQAYQMEAQTFQDYCSLVHIVTTTVTFYLNLICILL